MSNIYIDLIQIFSYSSANQLIIIIHILNFIINMEKEKYLECIYQIMRKNDITVAELNAYIRSKQESAPKVVSSPNKGEFDLLCHGHDATLLRLPFETGRKFSPIGIFPFSNDNRYISLDEREDKKHTDKDVETKYLLDVDFGCAVDKVKDRLNIHLKKLKKPILDGTYLADCQHMRGCGWLIDFNVKHGFSSDYYGGNEKAKCRYQGTFPANK